MGVSAAARGAGAGVGACSAGAGAGVRRGDDGGVEGIEGLVEVVHLYDDAARDAACEGERLLLEELVGAWVRVRVRAGVRVRGSANVSLFKSWLVPRIESLSAIPSALHETTEREPIREQMSTYLGRG